MIKWKYDSSCKAIVPSSPTTREVKCRAKFRKCIRLLPRF